MTFLTRWIFCTADAVGHIPPANIINNWDEPIIISDDDEEEEKENCPPILNINGNCMNILADAAAAMATATSHQLPDFYTGT